MHDVFISYNTKNQFEADLVKNVVKTNGFSCWMAPESIPIGSNYAKEIPVGIRDARVVVLILSQAAQDSIWVTREIELAVNSGKIIVPFAVEACTLRDTYNFYLASSERIDAYQRRSVALETLIQRIGVIVRDGILPAAIPAEKAPERENTEKTREISDCALSEFVKDFIHSSVIAGHKNYRNQNINGLRKHLQIPAEDEIFLAHDDTLFHSGKNGFALCTSGIYCADVMSERSYMSWKNFLCTERFEFLSSELYAHTPSGCLRIAYLNTIEKDEVSMLLQSMEQLRAVMCKTFGVPTSAN